MDEVVLGVVGAKPAESQAFCTFKRPSFLMLDGCMHGALYGGGGGLCVGGGGLTLLAFGQVEEVDTLHRLGAERKETITHMYKKGLI